MAEVPESEEMQVDLPAVPDLAYDPDQDPAERRGVRHGYRSLDLQSEGLENGHPVDADFVIQNVKVANKLFGKVKNTGEATMDSGFFLKASMKSTMLAKAMKAPSSAFDVEDFVAKLVTFMGGRGVEQMQEGDVEADVYDDDDDENDTPLHWERIGWKALTKSRRVPAMDFMLGALDVETKKRTHTKRSNLEMNIEDQMKPQNITEKDLKRDENETSRTVAVLSAYLKSFKAINLFKFIVNPDDFGQSVENLFYLSFLIREGGCALSFENGEPIIRDHDRPSPDDYAEGVIKQQMVMELDMVTWRRAIETFDIKKSILPVRPKTR